MSQQANNDKSLALQTAWQRYAEFDASALEASKRHLSLRWWVIVLAVVATLLAILTQLYGHSLYHRGQIAMLVKQAGGQPAMTDFVYWCREKIQ